MTSFLIPVAAAVLIVAACTGALVRRDRRWMASACRNQFRRTRLTRCGCPPVFGGHDVLPCVALVAGPRQRDVRDGACKGSVKDSPRTGRGSSGVPGSLVGEAIGGAPAEPDRQSPTRCPASAWQSRSACCSSTTAASAGSSTTYAGSSTLTIWDAGRMAFGSPRSSRRSSAGTFCSAISRAASRASLSTLTDWYSTARSRARTAGSRLPETFLRPGSYPARPARQVIGGNIRNPNSITGDPRPTSPYRPMRSASTKHQFAGHRPYFTDGGRVVLSGPVRGGDIR